MRASVVICTHAPNVALLTRAIDAIVPQLTRTDAVELLIVDNASPSPVRDIPACKQNGVRVVLEPRLGLTAARERAAHEAMGDVVVFVDDDNILGSDYLECAIEIFGDERIAVMSGRVEPEYEAPPPPWLHAHEGALAIRRPAGRAVRLVEGFQYSDDFPIGAGMIVRRSVLIEYFAAAARGVRIEGRRGAELLAGEDTDLALFAIAQGNRVGCCGRLRLRHVIPRSRMTVPYIIRLNRGALRSAASVDRKWRSRFGASIFPFLHDSTWRVASRALLFGAFAFLPAFRVRAAAQRDLLLSRART